MKPVIFHRLAESELLKSAKFYDRRVPGLGQDFLFSVENNFPLIQRNPEIGKPGKLGSRSWKVKRFPFRIVYFDQPDRFWVIAVAHLSRRPDFWVRRIVET